MFKDSLTLPRGTPHVVVDPLHDFAHGAFVECYGEKDTEPCREVIRTLTEMTEAWRQQAQMILCRSLYRYNEFNIPKLEKLCVGGKGRRSLIPPEWFREHILKTHNSLFTGDKDPRELAADHEFFGVTGLTTTSCVIKTIEDCKKLMADKTIVVPADAVAVRKSRMKDQEAILERLSDPGEKQVVVVKSWRDILMR